MARLCAPSDSLLVYFIIASAVSTVLAASDYYHYEVNFHDTSDLHKYDFREFQHSISKREVPANATDDRNITNSINSTIPAQNPQSANKPIQEPPASNFTAQNLPKKLLPETAAENATQKPIALPTEATLNVTSTSILDEARLNGTDSDELEPYDPDSSLQDVLSKHNITTKTDSHTYYNSSFHTDPDVARSLWVDMSSRPDVKMNELLMNSHRKAATVKLSFDFPFYGHLIRNVTIATGGFLYTGDYVHTWLAATQYIAPLMSNFDTSLSNNSSIKYADNGTAFTVQWENVMLQHDPSDGAFTFQATLFDSGDINFVYKTIPVNINNISDTYHPVKVGLSDAYIMDHTVFLVRRKTIYEYHRINFKKEDIKNWTAIYLTALPTCLAYKDCASCVTNNETTYECKWCPSAGKCSNSMDRHRQEWVMHYCEKINVGDVSECSLNHFTNRDSIHPSDEDWYKNPVDVDRQVTRGAFESIPADDKLPMGVSEIVAVIFVIAVVMGLGVWVFYAYRNPHTTSGQMLIRYRPSQWRLRRGEPRYSVATIHM